MLFLNFFAFSFTFCSSDTRGALAPKNKLYPTPVRTTTLGACYISGGLAAVLAPWVAVFLPDQDSLPEWAPLLIFGIVAIMGSLASLLLPETLGHPLPDNFNDIENMKKYDKPMWKWINPRAWKTPR